MKRLAPHQQEQLGKLKEEAAKVAAVEEEAERRRQEGPVEGARKPFPSKLG